MAGGEQMRYEREQIKETVEEVKYFMREVIWQ